MFLWLTYDDEHSPEIVIVDLATQELKSATDVSKQ